MKRGAIACMRSLLLLLLLVGGEANGWILGGKKGGKDAPGGKKKVVQASLPPSAFVRIFALPSEEAKMAQHRLGELLASACKDYARNGGCKMFSASQEGHRIRVLEFRDGEKRSVIAYMLQDNDADADIEKALDDCEAKLGSDTGGQENGKDYRCYMSRALNIPTREKVLEQMRGKMEEMEVYKELKSAPHKSIFLTADPRLIIYQESQRLVGSNGDYDFFLQKLRDSFRRIVEWLAWQHQQIATLTAGTPMLYSHAEELDINEKVEVERVLEFLGITGHRHVVGKPVVTAERGELTFQKERLRKALQTLPPSLVIDIEEFLDETLQDKRLVEQYVSGEANNRTAMWPEPHMLQELALDNTLLVTAATCAYAPLIINWVKHVHDLGIPCYLVIALDDEIYNFLHGWVPQHVVRAPANFTTATPRQYAPAGSGAARHVSRARLSTLKAITDQGYNVAWSDADISMVSNIFTIMSRWWDFAGMWANGTSDPTNWVEKTAGYKLKFTEGRTISPAFLYFRGSHPARAFLAKWLEEANKTGAPEDGVILNTLLHDPEVNALLNIQMLPESTFPTGDKVFGNSSAAYQKAWETTPAAWAHPDHVTELDEKVSSLSGLTHGKFWMVDSEDPIPTCARPTETYAEDGSALDIWPPHDRLAKIAQDNTIFVTSASCPYADLATNWIKHVWDLQITCFFVAAADQPTADFLEDWLPDHAALMPERVAPQVKKYAQKSTPEYTKMARSRPVVLHQILEQGYNVAWSDADVAWLRNPFVMFDKSPDLVLAWADNSKVSPGAVFEAGQFAEGSKGREVGVAFVYARPSKKTLALMTAWAKALDGSLYVDEAAALNKLLGSAAHKDLSIGIFPSAAFPTAEEVTAKSTKAALEEAWDKDDNKPAWLHADSALAHDDKTKLFKANSRWKLEKDEPQPKCSAKGLLGRKLGDGSDEEEVPAALSSHSHHHHGRRNGNLR